MYYINCFWIIKPAIYKWKVFAYIIVVKCEPILLSLKFKMKAKEKKNYQLMLSILVANAHK